MYLLVAVLPIVLILAYESLYSKFYIDRYYSRITLLAYALFAVAVSI